MANKIGASEGGTGVSGLREDYEHPLWLLMATTGLVLLIACANLANLLLAIAGAAVGLVAGYGPARRAAGLEPMIALRDE